MEFKYVLQGSTILLAQRARGLEARKRHRRQMCRKVAEANHEGTIEMWGDGQQTRSFLCIDECLEGVRRLVESDFSGPVNIGSDEMITLTALAEMVMEIAGKRLGIQHIPGPLGVRGRQFRQPAYRRSIELDSINKTSDWDD